MEFDRQCSTERRHDPLMLMDGTGRNISVRSGQSQERGGHWQGVADWRRGVTGRVWLTGVGGSLAGGADWRRGVTGRVWLTGVEGSLAGCG